MRIEKTNGEWKALEFGAVVYIGQSWIHCVSFYNRSKRAYDDNRLKFA